MHHQCIEFEKRSRARTYLIFDENNIDLGIIAFFAVSFKTIEFSGDAISKSARKAIDAKRTSQDIDSHIVNVYLIGQLAKNSGVATGITLNDILNESFNIFLEAQQLVGGRTVLLECEDELIELYEKAGFKYLQKPDSLNQLYIQIKPSR